MPKNRLLYFGMLIVVATVLLWVGAQLTKRIEWFLPYSAGIGAVLIVAGFLLELRHRKLQTASPPPEPLEKSETR